MELFLLLRYPLVSGLFGCPNHVWKVIKRGKTSNPAFISIDFSAPFASQKQRCSAVMNAYITRGSLPGFWFFV